MSKQDEAGLILKLYELRREDMMRRARDWYFRDFHPESINDYNAVLYGPNSGHMRMVISYWDMAAALVNHGAIDLKMFDDANGEHIGVFSRVEPLLKELRAAWGERYLVNLEKLIDATPNGRQRVAHARDQMKAARAKLVAG